MNKLRNKGFTLIEMMVSLVIISLAFTLLYRTYFTIQKNIKEIEKNMKETEILYNFLSLFKSEINEICDSENLNLEKKRISFFSLFPDLNFPVEIEYIVENIENGEKLIRIQRNILNDYEFKISILKCEGINFLFYFEEGWKEIVEKDTIPEGIAIELNFQDKKIFYPVYLNLIKDEKK
jgi:prepilin-type N-terminal cleavage/methylation domain-containing protein